MATTSQAAAVERIVEKLRGAREVGSVRIIDVEASLSRGSEGEPVVRVVLTLSDPPKGQETWSLTAIQRLLRQVRELVVAEEADLPPAVVEVRPESPDDPAPAS